MQTGNGVEFKSLLTKDEYERLIQQFNGSKTDFQTNYYFDTPRFSLKALDTSLRVCERDTLELNLKRKKGYMLNEIALPITKEQFAEIKETGIIPLPQIQEELLPLIGDQKVINFLSLSTLRTFFQYKSGIIYIDKTEYLGIIDYEVEYEATNYHQGKKEFIEIINEFAIHYKKSEKKLKRAYNAYKKLH